MNFNSWQFLVFLPVVVGLYWLLPHKFRWVMLLICSYFFYMSWNAWLIILIMTTTVTAYVASNLMKKTQSRKVRKALLIATLIICLGILIFFKFVRENKVVFSFRQIFLKQGQIRVQFQIIFGH